MTALSHAQRVHMGCKPTDTNLIIRTHLPVSPGAHLSYSGAQTGCSRRDGEFDEMACEIEDPADVRSECVIVIIIIMRVRPTHRDIISVGLCVYSRKHSVNPYSGMSHFPSVEQDLLWSPINTKSWLHSNVTLVLGTNKKLLFRPKRGVSRTPHEITANKRHVIVTRIMCHTCGYDRNGERGS